MLSIQAIIMFNSYISLYSLSSTYITHDNQVIHIDSKLSNEADVLVNPIANRNLCQLTSSSDSE